MALDHPDAVRSLTLVSSWAGPDAYFNRQFDVRKAILQRDGIAAYTQASALFLFSPTFACRHPETVEAWITTASSGSSDPTIMAKRIEMILAHDQRERLASIDAPCLVVVGDQDICTPPHASEELADLIPRARLQQLVGGHLIYKERPGDFYATVAEFLETT